MERLESGLSVLRCRRSLPSDTKVNLIWGHGIATASGRATRADQVLDFRTRPDFTVRMECERVNANAPCLPMRPVRIAFSAPVPSELAHRIKVTDASGRSYAPAKDDEGAPLRGGASLRRAIPRAWPPHDRAWRGAQGRLRPRSRQCRSLSARGALRRVPAARQVLGNLRHPRDRDRRRAARHRAERRAADRWTQSDPAAREGCVRPDAAGRPGSRHRELAQACRRDDGAARRLAARGWRRAPELARAHRIGIGLHRFRPDQRPQAARVRKRPGVRSDRHTASRARLLYRRAREPAARTGAPWRGPAALRDELRARHEHGGAFQVGPRIVPRLGHRARYRPARARGAAPRSAATAPVGHSGKATPTTMGSRRCRAPLASRTEAAAAINGRRNRSWSAPGSTAT